MRIVAIIQARMGSTRLPGKVLKEIIGKTMLARVVRRTGRSKLIDEIVVATTTEPCDCAIVDECNLLGVRSFRGAELDVLDRYYQAAKAFSADAVVRVTSDCPLIDPEIIDKVIQTFLYEKADYASNNIVSTYPLGLDAEIFTFGALEKAWHGASKQYEHVHVTPYIHLNPTLFRLSSVTNEEDNSDYRWTVDTHEDLELIRNIYSRMKGDDNISWRDVLALMKKEPELAYINCHIKAKSLEEC